jgi:hypothetical protein
MKSVEPHWPAATLHKTADTDIPTWYPSGRSGSFRYARNEVIEGIKSSKKKKKKKKKKKRKL